MLLTKFSKSILFGVFAVLLVSCSQDEDGMNEGGEVSSTSVYLTDSPVDNPEISGVFITVAEVQVNGKALEGFSKSTIEISSLTEGKTKLLGNVDLEIGSSSNVVLVLEENSDAAGNAPANYVLTTGGEKKAILSSVSRIEVSDKAEILQAEQNELIIDFDLRKSIVQNSEGNYSFVSSGNLSNSIRVANRAETGTIEGNISNYSAAGAEAVVVYAYKAGSYSESEADAGGSATAAFSNAVTSTAVAGAGGDFSLHFLEEGEYELIFASYEDEDNNGKLEYQGRLEMDLAGELTLNEVMVEANTTVNLNVAIEGLLNL